jgi:hypothetical protein
MSGSPWRLTALLGEGELRRAFEKIDGKKSVFLVTAFRGGALRFSLADPVR